MRGFLVGLFLSAVFQQVWIPPSGPGVLIPSETANGTGSAPGGSNGALQFNNSLSFGGVSNWSSDGSNLVLAASGGFGLQWVPANAATQNGSWTLRAQPQANTNDPTRRDDTVGIGWNRDCSVATANTSGLAFESYFVTSQGVRQSETYFVVGDCAGHSQRPIAINYDIDANLSTTLFAGNSYQFTNPAGTVLFGQFSTNALLADQFQIQGDGATQTFFKSNGSGSTIDLFLTPKGNGNINLQTSQVAVSAPLLTDSSRNVRSGTFKGSTTTIATVTGAVTNGHHACWDASGNLVDCGS